MTANDDYKALTTQLGCEGSERLQRILENIMTPDQAKMVIALPGTPAEVAEKTGFDVKETTAGLEDLFSKGAVEARMNSGLNPASPSMAWSRTARSVVLP